MRRYGYPFLGKQYLLNKNTNELHDLDNEHQFCEINKINAEHILMFEKLDDGLAYQKRIFGKSNGCYWCLRPHHND